VSRRRCDVDVADAPAAWLMSNTINRLVLAITSKETLETLERWQFDIIREDDDTSVSSSTVPQGSSINGLQPGAKPKEKTEKEVQTEIREIMKQITASVTFLPTLEEECRSNSFVVDMR
jgi:mitotic spindle assembly checkpoint protein MAD2